MQKTTPIMIMAVLSLLFSTAAAADPSTLYDSGPLSIGSWQVHLSRHTVTVDQPQEAELVVTKNRPELAIQAGFLIFNARLIPLTRFLTETDLSRHLPINLEATNRLRVFMVGTTDAGITITIHTREQSQPLPTASIGANPAIIDAGTFSSLSWTSEHAHDISIAPGIGPVATSGAIAVSPSQTTTYTIIADGPGGTASASTTVTVVAPLTIDIHYPPQNALVQRPDVMVCGTFDDSSAGATGITVNGKRATIGNGWFVVNHVPLEPGQNTITVTATDGRGQTQTAATTVTALIPEHHIALESVIEAGTAPLELTLHLDATFVISDSSIAFSGSPPVELIEIEPDQYRVQLMDPGITYFSAEALHEGVAYSDTMAVVVLDADEVDARLQHQWADMKIRFAEKNIEGAVALFDASQQDLYAELFAVLVDRLPQIAADMEEISMIEVINNRARYRIHRQETNNTGTYDITYYVYFIMDEDGIWKIYRF